MSQYRPVKTAEISWQEAGPYSQQFGDIYFSADGGQQETEYVFLGGNHLPGRWRTVERFTIAETGFGTGLNFLVTTQAWLDHAPPGARLHFISVESTPLKPDDLQKAQNRWPQLKKVSQALQQNYPPLCHGHHQRSLFDGRIELTLLFGDAAEMYADLDCDVDAWYLDGFAPGKNPDMWQEELYQQVARLSHQSTTFATFTAAGSVRRGLESVGFETQRPPGFGRKRNMLAGVMKKPPAIESSQPWFHFSRDLPADKKAIVIGGGLAGCFITHELAQRGWQIDLIEKHQALACEASGNLAGVVMPRLSADMDSAGQFYLSAFLHSQSWLNAMNRIAQKPLWHQSGVLQLESDSRIEKLSGLEMPQEILSTLDAVQAGSACGLRVKRNGLLFPLGGWLEPAVVCNYLIKNQHQKINCLFQHKVNRIEHMAGQWIIYNTDGELVRAPVLILTNAHDAARLLPDQTLNLQKIRGQVSYLQPTPASKALTMPVCFDGYLLPVHNNRHCSGATYDTSDDADFNSDQSRQIEKRIQNEFDGLNFEPAGEGRVGFRTSSEDHLPLIGPVPDPAFFRENYDDLHHGRPPQNYRPARNLPGLFLSVGHGSRGLVSCPLAAKLLADLICDSQSSIARSLQHAVNPARFMLRDFKRGLL